MEEFFSLQTLNSIILIALCLQNCAQKSNLSPNAEINVIWVILNSALQIAQVSCFLPNCYHGFNTLWSTKLLSCFGIRMLQSYWKFLDVVKTIFWRSKRFVALRCVNFICTDKNGCGRSYLLDLPVCAILECSCLQRWSSGEIFRIIQYSELPWLTL